MAFIETIDEDDATGPLAREYEVAIKRAGKVFQILKVQSQSPAALQSSVALYLAVMHGESALSRTERELIAVAVSRFNGCHY